MQDNSKHPVEHMVPTQHSNALPQSTQRQSWQTPTVTRLEIKRTAFKSSIGTDGGGRTAGT